MGEQRKSESWIAWMPLLLAALAFLCVMIVSATKGVLATLQIHLGLRTGRPGLELPLLLASPIYATLALLSYYLLKRLGYHSRKNAIARYLAAGWFVISLGSLLIWPAFVRGPPPHRRAGCLSNLKQLGLACHMYAWDNDESFPPTLVDLYDKYASDPELFVCPTAGKLTCGCSGLTRDEVKRYHLGYCYVAGLTSTDPADYVLAFDEERNHYGDGVNALYIDGHVKWLTDIEGLQEKLREQEGALSKQGREMRVIRPLGRRHPRRPARRGPPWYIGWAGAFACVATGFVIPVAGMILWEQWRRWRLARRE